MERLTFALHRAEVEENADLDACKLLGSPVFPEGRSEKLGLNDADYFVAQINCGQIHAPEPFPKSGYLYIFLNINTLKPRVLYFDEEPGEVLDGVNESFDVESCGDPTCLQMRFGEGDRGSFLFGDVDPDIGLEGSAVTAGKKTLLQIDALSLPQGEQAPFRFGDFGMGDGYWVFLIKEEDLRAKKFRNVEFVEIEN